jgi:hypothetical protein
LLTARELELTKELERLDRPPWGQAAAALAELGAAFAAMDRSRMATAYANLHAVIHRGADPAAAYEAVWSELRELFQEKAKLSQAESKRSAVLGGYVAVQDVMAVLMGMLEAVKENVPDRKARQKIQDRYNVLIGSYGNGNGR